LTTLAEISWVQYASHLDAKYKLEKIIAA